MIIDPTTYIKYAQVGEEQNGFRFDLLPPVIGKVQDAMNTQVNSEPPRPFWLEMLHDRGQTLADKLNQVRVEAQELSVYEDGPWAEYENILPGETSGLEFDDDAATHGRDFRYLLCPKDVIGFDLKTRRWCK